MSDESPKRDDSEESALWFSMSGLGLEFVLALLIPGAAGWWLDKKFGTGPWLLIVGIAFGFAVGLYVMIRASNRLLK